MMETNSTHGRPRKVCPQCSANVHIRRAFCGCGFAFRKARPDNVLQAKKRLQKANARTSETTEETVARKTRDRARKARTRASETAEETVARQTQSRAHMANTRATETAEETVARQTQNRAHMASTRATETAEETVARQIQNRTHMASKRATETAEETVARQTQNRTHMASTRATETAEETVARQIQNRTHMASKRATETAEETVARQIQNRTHMASTRASETVEETVARKTRDRVHKASMRATETVEETVARQTQDKLCRSRKRALESPEQMLLRKQTNKEHMSCKRSKGVSVEEAITAFHSETKAGPDFVCTCCHRMMYRKTVVLCNKEKYNKVSPDLLDNIFSASLSHISSDGKEYICKTCDRALARGSIPLQAKANGLQLSEIPPELSGLNALELRLISLRVPFMKMVALPSGKQRSIHGPAVNVPSKVDTICEVLPRLPSQSELVPLKLKRKVAYRGHYMYDYIRPQKLMDALRYLKANNPLYADVDINEQWIEEAMVNDEELCQYLVEQESDTMEIECQDHTSDTPNPPEPMECSVDKNEFSIALQQLKAVAKQNSFIIHDVPLDGNCMFSSISYQLQANGVYSGDSIELRQKVANHLEVNAQLYSDFLCQPVASEEDSYNADTAQPTPEDEFISSVSDPQLQSELRWKKYVKCLRQGAWGDHITLQAIADMLSVKINVFSSNHPMFSVTPGVCSAECEVFVGLILQYHYVGLDKLPVCGQNNVHSNAAGVEPTPSVPGVQNDTGRNTNNVLCVQSSNTQSNLRGDAKDGPSDNRDNAGDEALDDATIEEGDEHRRQISGAPMASMMCVENPESSRDIICIAPAEGEKPLNIMTDSNFEAMSNPDKFPFATGTFSSGRPKKLTYRKYFNQRLLDVDGRFARDLDYLFVAQYIVEAKQVLDDGNNFAWRQKPSRQFTAAQARDQTLLNQYVRKDKAYSFMKNFRGSPPYYQRVFHDLLAMIRQLGTPTWFFTLSAADLKWPDMIQTIARQYGVHYTDEQVATLSFEEKSNWLKRNPVTAARHFHYRLNVFFQDFLKSTAKPLGEIADYAIRIEFQARGSPHAHCVIWVKDAPEFGVSNDADVCAFIDKYVSCKLPEDGKLKELVLLLQNHRHSSYCRRNKSCRFSFPKPPSPKTLISKVDLQRDIEHDKSVLTKVQKLITDGNTELSLSELLDKAEVTEQEYVDALELSTNSSVVILQREPNECCINNYNPSVMLAWQANMDIQFVLNAYACVMYVASYIMKTERSMGELLKRVAAEARTDELKTQLRKVGSAFLTHREVSAQEAVYRLLSLPMKMLSRSVVFVDTNPKNERIAVLKSPDSLSQLEDNDTNVFQKSLIDRYQHRPESIRDMCLAEFAATYVVNYERNECDALPVPESDVTSTKITLTDTFGTMNKRKQPAVIRFRKYSKETDLSN